jgi:hypothetical protein
VGQFEEGRSCSIVLILAWITAAAAVCTALIAWRASSNWRKGLENERIDNALSALHDLDARIDRVVALRVDKEHVWNAYHEAWASRSRFNQAYVVAQRYHRPLPAASGARSTPPTAHPTALR